jgi:hypothetical protein
MNAEAKALKGFQGSHTSFYTVTTLGTKSPVQYLANRLDGAFLAGLDAGRKIERDEIEARLLAVARGE